MSDLPQRVARSVVRGERLDAHVAPSGHDTTLRYLHPGQLAVRAASNRNSCSHISEDCKILSPGFRQLFSLADHVQPFDGAAGTVRLQTRHHQRRAQLSRGHPVGRSRQRTACSGGPVVRVVFHSAARCSPVLNGHIQNLLFFSCAGFVVAKTTRANSGTGED